jgi:hypothetical protein
MRRARRPHGIELLLGVVPVRRNVVDPLAKFLQRGRHANHEELIEVVGGDGEELDALEQRMGRLRAPASARVH